LAALVAVLISGGRIDLTPSWQLISGAKNKNSPCKKREGLAEKRRKIPLVRRGRAQVLFVEEKPHSVLHKESIVCLNHIHKYMLYP
jgi:hypothetical protein